MLRVTVITKCCKIQQLTKLCPWLAVKEGDKEIERGYKLCVCVCVYERVCVSVTHRQTEKLLFENCSWTHCFPKSVSILSHTAEIRSTHQTPDIPFLFFVCVSTLEKNVLSFLRFYNLSLHIRKMRRNEMCVSNFWFFGVNLDSILHVGRKWTFIWA